MTPEEKAVIEAARVLYAEGQNDHWTACSLVMAVGKLIESDGASGRGYVAEHDTSAPVTLEALMETMGRINPRSRNLFARELRSSRVLHRAGRGRHTWSEIETAEDFASLPMIDVLDVRNAGPATVEHWRLALAEHGIETEWKR